MPEDLWSAAVALERRHGIQPVSRALGVSRARLRRQMENESSRKPIPPQAAFVELKGAQVLSRSAVGRSEKTMPEVVIEVSRGDGSRFSIRLGAGSELDVAVLVSAFQG